MSTGPRKIPVESDQGFHPLSSLKTEVEHVFERLADGFRHLRGSLRSPSANASESADGYEISVELPGMEPGDIDLSVQGDVLVVSGEHRDEREENDRNYYLRERSYGAFRRAFRLPDDVDRDGISAGFSRGVLDVRLPRAPDSSRDVRRIEVRED